MQLTDILKKKEKKQTITQKTQQQESEEIQEKPQQQKIIKTKFSDTENTPNEVYSIAILGEKDIFQSISSNTKFEFNKIINISDKIINCINNFPDDILVLTEKSTPDLYLYSHIVNVSILSTFFGLAMNYSEDNLKKLTVCSLLHDLGMIKYKEIFNKQKKLTSDEFLEIKLHPEYTKKLLENIKNIPNDYYNFLKEVILQIHERVDGNGYPFGIKGKDMHEMAKIISIVDIYEALTHPRAWRNRYLPHEGIKMLIDFAETSLDIELVKKFISIISLYPPGSYVELNTGEIGRVIGVNKDLPTRTKIKVIIDAEGNRIIEEKIIDLSKNSLINIVKPVDETKIKSNDKKLILEIRARKWWIK